MDIFNIEAQNRLGLDNVFMKLHRLLDWEAIGFLLKPTRQAFVGKTGYNPVKLFRALLLGQWHSLSDRELEHALRVRLDFMLFCDFSAHEAVPDHSTLCRFRNIMVEHGLYDLLLKAINAQLIAHGLKVESADHAVIDATVIESAARPRKQIDIIPVDREEDEVASSEPPQIQTRFSVDPDARWLKKGKRSYFGYKGFARVDPQGYFEHCKLRPANEAEAPYFEQIIKGATAKRILSDKGNASARNRNILKANGMKDGIMHRASRGHPLSRWQKRFNKLISKNRYVVEQSFGTLKRKFGHTRSVYMGLAKTEAQFICKAICVNLLKAANKIEIFVPPNPKLIG